MTVAPALLNTKLYVPQARSNLVPRPRLIERLDEGLARGRKLTLISAPAGFGKTTLLGEWLDHRRRSEGPPALGVAWLSLDEADNDLPRFLTYVIAALQTIEPGIGEGSLAALRATPPQPIEPLLTALINEIAALPQGNPQGLPGDPEGSPGNLQGLPGNPQGLPGNRKDASGNRKGCRTCSS